MCEVKSLDELDRVMIVTTKNGKTYNSEKYHIDKENKEYIAEQHFEKVLKQNKIPRSEVLKKYTARVKQDNEIYISSHAFDRLKERVGWNKKASLRMLSKVYSEGIDKSEISGYTRKWIEYREKMQEHLYEEKEPRMDTFVYGNHAFLFCNRVLITVLTVPTKSRIISILNHTSEIADEAV